VKKIELIKNIEKRYLPKRFFRRRKNKIEKSYQSEIEKAKREGDKKKVEELKSNLNYDLWVIEEEQEINFTKRLKEKATRLRVAHPAFFDEKGELSDYYMKADFGGVYFTSKGVKKIRDAIRDEERWIMEKRAHFIRWIASLTGLIGALTGLFAVILR